MPGGASGQQRGAVQDFGKGFVKGFRGVARGAVYAAGGQAERELARAWGAARHEGKDTAAAATGLERAAVQDVKGIARDVARGFRVEFTGAGRSQAGAHAGPTDRRGPY